MDNSNIDYENNMEDALECLSRDLISLGFGTSVECIGQFKDYYRELIKWNQKMNLTAITEVYEVFKKHFIDSLSIVKCDSLDLNKISYVIDLGTGAGFPGVPLKIMYPELNMVLVDSQKKRLNFLDNLIEVLHLDEKGGLKTVHGRAEDLAHDAEYRECFDLCVSRAVASMPVLCEWCLPFVKKGGSFAAYKSEKGREELMDSDTGLKILGAGLRETVAFELPESDISRTIFVFEKNGSTQKKYPRRGSRKLPLW